MTNPRSRKRTLIRVGIYLAVCLCLLVGFVWMNLDLYAAARPPDDLKTIEDFRAWKPGAFRDGGIYRKGGVTYTVMFGPAGGTLPSGEAAYLFDEQGQFVDWTPDSGDSRTKKHHFNLSRDGRD